MAIQHPKHDPKRLRVILEQTLIPENVDLTFKPMFGGIMAYSQGRVFASLWDGGLAIKLAPADQTALLDHEGAEYLRYAETEPPSKQYVKVPDEWLGDDVVLVPWLKKSISFVLTLPAPKPRKAKKAKA